MIVVVDTGPIHYLVLSGHIELLFRLYGGVLVPQAVEKELGHVAAPVAVKAWMANPPSWAVICAPHAQFGFERLGRGEREALRLAIERRADFVLIDESLARRIATERGLAVKGSLGVLEEAAEKLGLELAKAVEALLATGIYLDRKTISAALERDAKRQEQRRLHSRS